ncbi:MAG TPA: P27 family phage terminase small subunit [Candidatus Binatus sp.]|uniref:P27 family phage terminase small subunit n=1 Tax=Candidatus Binatus sp. TaxID=2811406 RepID=UPI002B4A7141|nr:P27 family phage terminase small subunit [Candidatus Binatus sp.]HKN13398.1 P27 family phage terminase small subunit [Candidatus Binatus sp.]
MPALTHGLYAGSKSALEIRARKIARMMRRLRVVADWLSPADESTARAYCELEILSASIFARLTETGVTKLTADGRDLEVRALVDAHRRMKQTQLAYANALGLTPLARTQLKLGSRDVTDISAAVIANVMEIGESRAAERAQRAKEATADVEGKDDGDA